MTRPNAKGTAAAKPSTASTAAAKAGPQPRDATQAVTAAPQSNDAPAQVDGHPPTTDATSKPTDAKGENKGEDGDIAMAESTNDAPPQVTTMEPAAPPDSDSTVDPDRQATNPTPDPALSVAAGLVPPGVDAPATRVPPETAVAVAPDHHGPLSDFEKPNNKVALADLSDEEQESLRQQVEASVRAQLSAQNDARDRQAMEAAAALAVLPERPFGTEPGEDEQVIETISRAKSNEEIRGGTDIVYRGLRHDILYPHAISVIVPDGTQEELEDVGYDGPFTTGTSYNLRAGVVTPVRGKHVEWLIGHPSYLIERA